MSFLPFLSVPVLGLALVACSGSSSSPQSSTSSTSSADTFACLVQLKGFAPQCQLYDASGADAANAITQLRAQCISQGDSTLGIVDACPPQSLGGCKTPVTVTGGGDVKLFVTTFEYASTADSGLPLPSTPEQVKSDCADNGADAVFVAAP